MRRLKSTCIAIPPPVLEWLDEEAPKLGMNRSSFVVYHLNMARQTQQTERLRRLEVRVAELERRMSPGAQ